MCGSLMSQECPAQKLFLYAVFRPDKRIRQFVHNIFVHDFGAPLSPPLPTSKVTDFLLNLYSRTSRIASTQPRSRKSPLKTWEPPARHRGPPGLSGPEPQTSPKRVRNGVPPRGGSPRVPKECTTESEKSPKTQLRTLFGLFSDCVAHSLRTLGLPGAGHHFGLFLDSGPKGPGRPLCLAGGFPTQNCGQTEFDSAKT